jgi:hypothetical protein
MTSAPQPINAQPTMAQPAQMQPTQGGARVGIFAEKPSHLNYIS